MAALPVAPRPGPIAAGAGSVWVGNVENRTLTRIDPRTRRILATIPLPAAPTGLAYGFRAVWVAHGLTGQLSRIDPQFNRRTTTIELTSRALYSPAGSVAVGAGWVWVVFGNSVLARVDPVRVRESGSTRADPGSSAIAVGSGSVWVANAGAANVQRFDPTTFEEGPLKVIAVGSTPMGLAADERSVWVAVAGDDEIARIDPGDNSISTIPVGERPEAVAVGAGGVWAANVGGKTVSRIDLRTRKVTDVVPIGNAPRGLTAAAGEVHVTVQAP